MGGPRRRGRRVRAVGEGHGAQAPSGRHRGDRRRSRRGRENAGARVAKLAETDPRLVARLECALGGPTEEKERATTRLPIEGAAPAEASRRRECEGAPERPKGSAVARFKVSARLRRRRRSRLGLTGGSMWVDGDVGVISGNGELWRARARRVAHGELGVATGRAPLIIAAPGVAVLDF